MLKLYILVFLSFLLSSCHTTWEEQHTKLQEASSYNTQLGLAYLKQGDRARAKHKLLLALSQSPDSLAANTAMAYFMEKTGEVDKARGYYQKAVAMAPNRGASLNNYGAFLCRYGQPLQAETYFVRAVKDKAYENTAGAYENAGICAKTIPNDTKAVFYFKKALEQDPKRKQSLYELVMIYRNQGHIQEALAVLQGYPYLVRHDRRLSKLANKMGTVEI